jgi:hypothetical protein
MAIDYDQLIDQFRKGHYPNYVEPEITFMPTYKRADLENDTYVNKKDQCPSYTDRILFKNNTRC